MISVIIPTYNRAKTIGRSIESVLKQTYTDIEVIVVDDGSQDNTKEVVGQLVDSRIKYYFQENAGACAARNLGIDVSKGEYIAFQDSDDVWKIDKLEKQIRIFELYDADIVICKLLWTLKDGAIRELPEYISDGFVNPIKGVFGIGTQTIMAKREVFQEYNFDIDMPRYQDFELLFRATKKYSLYCINEGLVYYQTDETSISNNYKKLYDAARLFVEKHPDINEYPLMSNYLFNALINAAKVEKNAGRDYMKYVKLSQRYRHGLKGSLKRFLLSLNMGVINNE